MKQTSQQFHTVRALSHIKLKPNWAGLTDLDLDDWNNLVDPCSQNA